jgi:hypothetical protein
MSLELSRQRTSGPGTPNNNPCYRNGKINAGYHHSDFTFAG